jgi:hypothetical protein
MTSPGKTVFFIASLLLLQGCLSFEITTDPPGADITFDGEYLGKSPCTGQETMKSVSHVYTIIARMKGYEDAIVTFPNGNAIQVIPSNVHIPMKPLPGRMPAPAQNLAVVTIHNVTTVPSRVAPGAEFDLEVEFTVADAGSRNAVLPVEVTYKIMQGRDTLLVSDPASISVANGVSTLHAEKRLQATTTPGFYCIEAEIKYQGKSVSRSSGFSVE